MADETYFTVVGRKRPGVVGDRAGSALAQARIETVHKLVEAGIRFTVNAAPCSINLSQTPLSYTRIPPHFQY